MNEKIPTEILVDPLSDTSRRERRNLVVVSALSALIAKTGLIPTQISALGIVFKAPAQSMFLVFLALCVGYLMASFLIYGLTDFLVWRHKYQEYLERRAYAVDAEIWDMRDPEAQHARQQAEEIISHLPSARWAYAASNPAAMARMFFEFIVPLILGVYAMSALLCA